MARREHPATDLSAYVDGDLRPLGRRRMRRHLLVCPPCRLFVEQITGVGLGLRRAPLEAIGRDQRAELVLVYERWRSEQPDHAA